VNLYSFAFSNPVNLVDPIGLIAVNALLQRKSRGHFAIYGSLTITTNNAKVNKCCEFPLTFKTLERPPNTRSGGDAVPSAPFGTPGPFYGTLREDGNGNALNTCPNALAASTGGALPSRPTSINKADWSTALTHEWNIGNGGINVHAGMISTWSTGCVLVGTQYTEQTFTVSTNKEGVRNHSYPGVADGTYIVPGFEWADTILSQLRINAAIACAERISGTKARIKFTRRGHPVDHRGKNSPLPVPEQPKDSRSMWDKIRGVPAPPPRAVPINDSFAF
jgi:hypothetical protein